MTKSTNEELYKWGASILLALFLFLGGFTASDWSNRATVSEVTVRVDKVERDLAVLT